MMHGLRLINVLLILITYPGFSQTFVDSNLPLLVVNVGGVPINDDPKIPGRLWVVDKPAGQRNALADTASATVKCLLGIDVRGNSSQSLPKKSYGIELRKASGSSLDLALLGMPAESDWVLYASYRDKTFARDPFTYWLARQMGRYSSRTRFVELFIDDQYMGIYVLEERVKRGADRVPITKMNTTDLSGDKLTGGYLLKIDPPDGGQRFGSVYTNTCRPPGTTTQFEVAYPKPSDLQPAQFTYISNYVSAFEAALQAANYTDPVNGYARYADVDSFVDYFLLSEVSKNSDAYMVSVYFYKDRDSKGGKLTMGPFWDYDMAWGNGYYFDQPQPVGWAWTTNVVSDIQGSMSFWWERLLRDRRFVDKVRSRYRSLRRTVLSDAVMLAYADSAAAVLNEAQVRNFQRWNILNVNDIPLVRHGGTFAGEISYFKSWIQARMAYLDANIDRVGLAVPPSPTQVVCLPQTQFTLPATSGSNLSYNWLLNGQQLAQTEPLLTVSQSGTYVARLSLAGYSFGCTLHAEPTALTFVAAPGPVITAAFSLSADRNNVPALNLLATGTNAAYTWTGPNQFTAVGAAASVSPARLLTNGTYYLTARDAIGCQTTDSVLVDYRAEMADLSVSVSAPQRVVAVGQPLRIDVAVTNEGPADAHDVVLVSRLPTGLAAGAAVNGLVQAAPITVRAGTTQVVSYTVQPTAAAAYQSTVELRSASRVDPDSRLGSGTGDGEDDTAGLDFRTLEANDVVAVSPNPDQWPLPPVQPNQPAPSPAKANVSLQLIADRLVLPLTGELLVTVRLYNAGGLLATNDVVRINLPPGLAYVPDSGGDATGQTVTLTFAAIPAATAQQQTFRCRLISPGNQLISAEVVAADQPDPDSQPNSGTTDGQNDCAQLLIRSN